MKKIPKSRRFPAAVVCGIALAAGAVFLPSAGGLGRTRTFGFFCFGIMAVLSLYLGVDRTPFFSGASSQEEKVAREEMCSHLPVLRMLAAILAGAAVYGCYIWLEQQGVIGGGKIQDALVASGIICAAVKAANVPPAG